MAQPHKGPRRGYNLRWADEDRLLAKARAEAAGMTVVDYLVTLMRRDEVDPNGCPIWAPDAQRSDQLPLGLTA